MPVNEEVLGFSNKWYVEAIESAERFTLPSGTRIKLITPEYFLATKFEAFIGRGKGDYIASKDLEDIVFVLEHRSQFILELSNCNPILKSYFAMHAKALFNDAFLNVLPGLTTDDAATRAVTSYLRIMCNF